MHYFRFAVRASATQTKLEYYSPLKLSETIKLGLK